MPSHPLDLTSSPATRDILTSFTSTADDSPSVRLAQAQSRERRRATRQARTGSISSAGAGGGTTVSSPDTLGDDVWHDASLGLPRLRLNHDAASQISGSPKYQTESGSPASTRGVPLPPVDDTPSQDGGEPTSAMPAPSPSSSSTTATATATATRRSSSPIAIAEIPPYRGPRSPLPSTTAVVGSPAPVSEQGDSGSSAATTKAQVKIVDGGVIARLKAARLAKLKATGAGSPTASPGSSTPLAGSPSTSLPPIPSSRPSPQPTDLPFDLPTPPSGTGNPDLPPPPSPAVFSPIPSTPDLAEPSAHAPATSRPIVASTTTLGHEGTSTDRSGLVETAASPGKPSNEQILADMRARNAAKEQSRGTPTIDPETNSTGRLSFSPSRSIIAPPASRFAPPPPRPSSIRSSSTPSSKSSHPSPHKNAPTHPSSPTAQSLPAAPRFEVIHESTPESRAAEIEAWFRGERKGGRIVDLEDWKHHSLSEVEEQTERSSISTRPTSSSHGGDRTTHTRNSSINSLPSLPAASPRAGRPLSTFSVSSSTGRQLADGSYHATGAPLPPSPSKRRPAPNIIETAARMLEGYQGSDIKKKFDEGTEELRRYLEREREILGITGGSSKVVPVDSSSEAGSSRKEQRSVSPTRRPLSPELARKAAVFGGDTSAARGQQVFGGESEQEAVTFSQREERKRMEREVEREKRRREREEREAARRGEEGAIGSQGSARSNKDSPRGSLPAHRSEMGASGAGAEIADDLLPPPPVVWEGALSAPPPSISSSAALANPALWISRYAVLTADTLEFRPTDSTGPFTPVVALFSSELRKIEDGLKASQGFKPFKVITRGGEEHLFACTKAIDKVNWLVAFENVASPSHHSRTASSILGDGSPRSPTFHPTAPSKKALTPLSSPRHSQQSASLCHDPGVDPIKSATQSLRRGVSFKSFESKSGDARVEEKVERSKYLYDPEKHDQRSTVDELAYLGEVSYSDGNQPTSIWSRPSTSSAPQRMEEPSNDMGGAPLHPQDQPSPRRDLFGILRDRPLPPSPSAIIEPPTFTSVDRPLPSSFSSPSKDQFRQPVFSTSPSPYTHRQSRSELPTPPPSSVLAQDAPPLRPTPLRPHSQSSSFTASANSGDSHPSRLSYADLLAPGPARELREALSGMLEATMQMGRETEEQEDALRKLKHVTALIIQELDAQADLGRAEAVELRWELRDKLFETYDALKQAQSRAPSRAPSHGAYFGDPNRPRSRTSSDSAYEEEDLARINLLTRSVLSMLDEVAGDGGSRGERFEASSNLPHLSSRQPRRMEQKFSPIPSPIRHPRTQPHPRNEPSSAHRRDEAKHGLPRHPIPQAQFDDGASQTTRGAGHSASEHASWEEDRLRFEEEARIATTAASPLGTSVASPTRTMRERSLAADMLEGRAARAVLPSSIDLATFQDSLDPPHRRRGDPAPQSLYPQVDPSPSMVGGQATRAPQRRRKDPFGQSTAEPLREMSHWSRTTSTDGVEPVRDHLSHPSQFEYDQISHDGTSQRRFASDHARSEHPRLRRNAASEGYAAGSASGQSLSNVDVLRGLQEQFRITGDHISTANHQRDQIGLFVNQLAEVMNDSRHSNDNQFERLVSSVEALRTHLGELPDLLAHRLRSELGSDDPNAAQSTAHHLRSTSAPPFIEQDQQQPVIDEDHGSVSTLVDQLEVQAEAQIDGATAAEGGPHKVKFGVNPLSSFAHLDKKMADSRDLYDDKGKLVRRGSASGSKKSRGPRMPGMPGLKIWGGPAPVSTAEHAARWGGGARSLSRAQDKAALDHALEDDAAARKPKHGPVVEAIKTDEGLAQALQNLAEGTGEKEIDAGTMAIAIFEILQSMREISRKQKEQEDREKQEKAKNGGLSRREKAELEAKREEIKRLEAIAGLGGSREAKLDQALSALQAKSTEQDTLLQKIAAAMETSKKPSKVEMDPALKEETKKLLGQVKSGVDDHVKDFRGQLTNEVQRMFKEVGKLRDEKKSLQTDIAELMSFQAKHGGSSSGGSAKALAETKPTAPSSPLQPGMPTSGFFGPRAMK